MLLRMEVGLGPNGDPATAAPKGGGALPSLRPMSIVVKRLDGSRCYLAWAMEVGLGPGHIVLDGDPAPLPRKGVEPPILGPFLLWRNGWIHQDATWYGGRPRPRSHCARWGPSPPQKGVQPSISICDPCLLWPNGCMYQDTTWYRGRPQPRRKPTVNSGPSRCIDSIVLQCLAVF